MFLTSMKIRNIYLNDPDCFYKVCAEVLNRDTPQKKKFVREIINHL